MRILIFIWKDRANPLAGGAELLTEEIARRLVARGHQVTLLTSNFPGGAKEEAREGIQIIRVGNRVTVYWQAYRYYRQYLVGRYDVVIDEINTVPFFTPLFAKERVVALIPQLAREIWFYEMIFPLSFLGYLLEPLYIRLYRRLPVITISQSTKDDLRHLGFSEAGINLIPVGITFQPLQELPPVEEQKEKAPTILYLGSLRPMKRPEEAIRALPVILRNFPKAQLWIAGSGRKNDQERLKKEIRQQRVEANVRFFGCIPDDAKKELLAAAHILVVTSVREGWGLVVTEANAMGTPAVVYNVNGLRDSVSDGETGLICRENTPQELAHDVLTLLYDKVLYERLRENAWRTSQHMHFGRATDDFARALELVNPQVSHEALDSNRTIPLS